MPIVLTSAAFVSRLSGLASAAWRSQVGRAGGARARGPDPLMAAGALEGMAPVVIKCRSHPEPVNAFCVSRPPRAPPRSRSPRTTRDIRGCAPKRTSNSIYDAGDDVTKPGLFSRSSTSSQCKARIAFGGDVPSPNIARSHSCCSCCADRKITGASHDTLLSLDGSESIAALLLAGLVESRRELWHPKRHR